MKDDKTQKLTPRQALFVEAYAGNATEAAKKAGYAHPQVMGCQLLSNPKVSQYIKQRSTIRKGQAIADRSERQRILTEILRNEDETPANRMKAIELLGRSEGDYIEHKIVENRYPQGKTFWELSIEYAREIRATHSLESLEEEPVVVCPTSIQLAGGPGADEAADGDPEGD